MIDIAWAFVKANLFCLRNPFKYKVVSKSTVCLRGEDGNIEEEISYIGVMQDIPDVTDYSIIHKLVPIRTYYGKWVE